MKMALEIKEAIEYMQDNKVDLNITINNSISFKDESICVQLIFSKARQDKLRSETFIVPLYIRLNDINTVNISNKIKEGIDLVVQSANRFIVETES